MISHIKLWFKSFKNKICKYLFTKAAIVGWNYYWTDTSRNTIVTYRGRLFSSLVINLKGGWRARKKKGRKKQHLLHFHLHIWACKIIRISCSFPALTCSLILGSYMLKSYNTQLLWSWENDMLQLNPLKMELITLRCEWGISLRVWKAVLKTTPLAIFISQIHWHEGLESTLNWLQFRMLS